MSKRKLLPKTNTLKEIIITPDKEYNEFLNSLPDNLKYTPEEDYHTYLYWKLWGKPKNFNYTLTHPDEEGNYMYNFDNSDNSYHANSLAWGKDGIGYFMKPKHHPTVKYELDYYNNGLITEEGGKLHKVSGKDLLDWKEFKNNYTLDTSGKDYKYIPKIKK